MSATREGGLKSAKKLKQDDPEFYVKLGKLGGKAKVSKGFGKNKELAREAGRRGGLRRKNG